MGMKKELCDELLEDVIGGEITYTWDGTQGTIGINGTNPFILLNKEAFIEYYNSVKGTGIKESQVLTYLLQKGYIRKK